MKRYFLIALVIHLCLFIRISSEKKTLGDMNIKIKRNIPISYNVKSPIESIEKSKQKTVETPKEEKKEIKKEIKKETPKEIKSKMSKPKAKKEPTPKQEEVAQKSQPVKEEKHSNFIENSDGTYTAISSEGIDFKILKQIDPEYPKQAEMARYDKTVVVEVKFLVGTNGEVEDIKILKSYKKFGFDKEVMKALKRWRFEPIAYNGRKIKVYFNKEFIFTPKK